MKTLIPTLLLLVAASAHGTELNPDMVEFPREANAAFTTGTKEAQRCAAFWAIAAHCFAQTEDSRAPALAKRLSDEFDATTMYAASMAKKLGMHEQKFQEYSKTVTHELMQETNNNCDNLGVLIPTPDQIELAIYGNDVMDLTSSGLRSI
jgi:hypothetical protein